jgi:hypothetical protein
MCRYSVIVVCDINFVYEFKSNSFLLLIIICCKSWLFLLLLLVFQPLVTTSQLHCSVVTV